MMNRKSMKQVTREKAQELYESGASVYVTNDMRSNWKMPASYEYSSHAPAKELFNRSEPKFEGENRYFIAE